MGDQLWQIRSRPMWRSLEGEEDEPPFEGWSRRDFLKLLSASAALAAAGCERSLPEKILPYSVQPPDVVPGIPNYYATHHLHEGFAVGLLVKSNEGRPTKVEGNPDHPASLGATGIYEQALVLSVYDPDRAAAVRRFKDPASWEAFDAALKAPRSDAGEGLRLLLPPSSSPTLARLLARVRRRHPRMKVTFFPDALSHTLEGARRLFGRPLQPLPRVDRAEVILSLDADLLGQMPFSLRHSRHWAERRTSARPNRLYAVECAPSVTGLAADHRIRRRSGEVLGFARAVASHLPGLSRHAVEEDPIAASVARDLLSRPRGTTLIAVGEPQPPAVHALAMAMNAALGNLGESVGLIEPVLLAGDQDLPSLAAELRGVDTLVMLDGNPVYTAPADLDLAGALSGVAERIYLGAYENETARHATWFAPLTHPLEEWGDGRAYDGTLSLAQPLLLPFHGGRSVLQLLAALAGEEVSVRKSNPPEAFQKGIAGTSSPSVSPPVITAIPVEPVAAAPPLEINFRNSPTICDGRFANNAWLQELPEPITKLTWGNAILISPKTAAQRHLHSQDRVELSNGKETLQGPILVTPGHADGAVTLWLGYGRGGSESLAVGVGFDAGRLRHSTAMSFTHGELRRIPGSEPLAHTQRHFGLHGREIALALTRDSPPLEKPIQPSLMATEKPQGLQWAMSIDLARCTGCSSCMVACQAENNIPVVGKENVLKQRQMHWLRIDTYFHGTVEDPAAVHQPMACQHCEAAPCEYVCPVNATVHSSDGLNEMVYNRCVGTRFCSNNCPYKVRRFNWFNWFKRYSPLNGGSYQLAHNPDVTVRDRGVMEKCSYCVQRIRGAEIRARVENREVAPGDVVTACQQACPTGAIQFGSLSHPETAMVKMRQEPRAYAVLEDQGTRPRTQYLARLDNPNRDLE